ncbi:unnamed protein product, partial [Dovyalis caffra]
MEGKKSYRNKLICGGWNGVISSVVDEGVCVRAGCLHAKPTMLHVMGVVCEREL